MREAEAQGSFGERSRSSKHFRRQPEPVGKPKTRGGSTHQEPAPLEDRRRRSVTHVGGIGNRGE
eukprot:5767977-Amphidinium_carterae.1